MWSSSRPRKILLSVLLMAAALGLAGCTGFSPVYGEHGLTNTNFQFTYGKPADRLAQIIIQDLSLHLGKSQDPDAPLITVTAWAGARGLTRTSVAKPMTQYEAKVTASYTVVADGKIVALGNRTASASYTADSQVLADDAAYNDAIERAAHAVAETVRLSIIAELGAPVRPIDDDSSKSP